MLCSHDYGEIVNLAKALIAEIDTVNYSEYDNCRDNIEIRAKSSGHEGKDEISLFPNPVRSQMTVILPSHCQEGYLEIFNMTGQLLEHLEEITNSEVRFDIKLSNGTYLLKFQSKDGDLFLRKFVVLN